jgi:hypothetical protein
MAHLWNGLTEPAKLRILRSQSRINSFNIIISEFYGELNDNEKNNPEILLDKMNTLVLLIIENETLYKEKYEELINIRNNFTKIIRELIISKDSVINLVKEINNFFGDERMIIEEIYLSNTYYNTIPHPDLDVFR